MSKAPKKIYLQWHSHDYIDITWCEDKLEDTDVEYIRRDIADKMLAACKAALFYINEDLLAHGLPLHLYYDWVTFSTKVSDGAFAISQVTCDSIEDQKERRAKVCHDWHCDGNAHIRIAEVVIKALEVHQARNAA